ncbi:MAG: glycogen debranching protein GlgX [Thermoguttaceae bacterium]|nr:glycogen debranching protein GlgX [Thermoguttaceae bacterium]
MLGLRANFYSNYLLPYGARLMEDGVGFSVISKSATAARLLLYDNPADTEPREIIEFDARRNHRGDVWILFVPGLKKGQLYHFQLDGPNDPERGLRFDGQARLIDPYAEALTGDFLPPKDGIIQPPKCVVVDNMFDWSGDQHEHRSLADSVIYELHVRGFTCSPDSGVQYPGTYRGLVEKIPYLKSLGVTAVELMPIHEYPQNEPDGTTKALRNYWGYDPIVFFAPHRGYAWDKSPGGQVREFKEMVLAFHQAGIEVFLDVVFNHTSEGNEQGATYSYKGIENSVYYMLDAHGNYRNYSGCGNTINGNHPWTREMIFSCLRYWVCNYHIDGFRFDLASILSRDRNGNLTANPPLLEMISDDPILSDTKIIAEAWDAAGAYQVGSFGSQRWAEWNGRYRDDVRRFWRGDPGMTGALATRLAGSSDLYQWNGRSPFCSINFVTSHDGFTLNDLVSYNYKHNEENGEENRDGDNNNFSYNYGQEGVTHAPKILAIRNRQVKNFFVTLLLSQGVPMIVAGDEVRRTQLGNNNAYCQDSPVSWFDWSLVRKNKDLLRFCQTLIAFRRSEFSLRRRHFLTGLPGSGGGIPDISWFDTNGFAQSWNPEDRPTLTCLLSAIKPDDSGEKPRANPLKEGGAQHHILMMMNAGNNMEVFFFPAVCQRQEFLWRQFINTAAQVPLDIFPDGNGPVPDLKRSLILPPYSLQVFTSKTSLN